LKAFSTAETTRPSLILGLEGIAQASDAVMVARGDLGVEIDIAEVPTAQKRIIATCRRWNKPVIIATQMLDSMQHSRIPTRAEATDVSNAILDGADACMLSAETAIGSYPREAVEMITRIAQATEPMYRQREPEPLPNFDRIDIPDITQATVFAGGRLAEVLGAKVVVVATRMGGTARCISNNRHFVPTVGVSDSDATLRQMCLYWGIMPLAGSLTDDPAEVLNHVVAFARKAGYLASGDRVVLLAGTGIHATKHNMMVVHELD